MTSLSDLGVSSVKNTRKNWLIHVILMSGVIVILFPFLWTIIASFKITKEFFRFPPTFWPDQWTLFQYKAAWNFAPIGRFLVNSAVQSACITFGQLLTASMAAYAFAKLEFRGREVLFYIVLATMMIPIHVTMIPLFVTMSKLGWDNTYQGLIIPFLANAFSIFLLRQFFMTVPQDLEDAAIIDGCSKARFLFRILIPVSRTGLAAAGIFTFVHHWNTYMWPLLITSSNRMRTVQIGLAMFVEREAGTDFGRLMAASVIVALPTIIAFLMGQKEFIEGITMTGIKG